MKVLLGNYLIIPDDIYQKVKNGECTLGGEVGLLEQSIQPLLQNPIDLKSLMPDGQKDISVFIKGNGNKLAGQLLSVYAERVGNRLILQGNINPSGSYGHHLITDRDCQSGFFQVVFNMRQLDSKVMELLKISEVVYNAPKDVVVRMG